MAKQEKKVGGVLAKLGAGLNKAVKAHAADETRRGRTDLPAGIKGGIAQVVECGFAEVGEGKQNAGKPYFFATAIVKLPTHHEDMPVAGLRTRIMENLFETGSGDKKISQEQHVDNVLNYLRLISGNDEYTHGCETGEQMEALATQLAELKPHIRFRTWAGGKVEIEKGKDGKFRAVRDGKVIKGPFPTEAALKAAVPYAGKEPTVNHTWEGFVEYEEDDAANAAAAVEEEPASEYTEAENAEDAAAAETTEEVAEEEVAEEATTLPEDLDELVAIADDGEHALTQEAGEKLIELAVAAGHSEEAARGAAGWTDVVEMINNPPAEEAAGPQVNETWQWHPITNGKKAAKAIDVKILKVDEAKGTCEVRRGDTKAVVKGVKVDSLIAKG